MKIIVRSSVAAVTALAVVVLAPAGSASAATTTVDNATAGRFAASTNWGTSAWSGQQYGANYRFATPYTGGSDAAWFKASIAASGAHLVEVWYPADPGYNSATPFVVAASGGNRSVVVDQRGNGGRWVSLGTFDLAAGDYNVVGVSRWTNQPGYVVADAVRITSSTGGSGFLPAAGAQRLAAQRVRRPAPRLSRDRPSGRHRHQRLRRPRRHGGHHRRQLVWPGHQPDRRRRRDLHVLPLLVVVGGERGVGRARPADRAYRQHGQLDRSTPALRHPHRQHPAMPAELPAGALRRGDAAGRRSLPTTGCFYTGRATGRWSRSADRPTGSQRGGR